MTFLAEGWRRTVAHLPEWLVTAFLVVIVTVLTCGVGWLVAVPNVPRLVARAAARGGEPRFADLWGLDGWLRRAVIGLVLAVGFGASSVLPLIGPVLFGAMVLWVPFLATDTELGVVDVFRAGWASAQDRLAANAILAAVTLGLGAVSVAACFLPAVVVWPWLAVSLHAAWETDRDRALAAAAR